MQAKAQSAASLSWALSVSVQRSIPLTVAAHWGRQSAVLRRQGRDQYPSLECRRAAGHPWPELLIIRAWSANSNALEVTQGLRADGRQREKNWEWGRVAPVATPQHSADKSQSHLTKSLTNK